MAEDNWKDTLYIWDGIVSVGVPEDKETQNAPVPLQWEGSWIPVTNVPDAADADAPKRHAFKKDIDADCKFLVRGTASRLYTKGETNGKSESEKEEDTSANDYENFYVAKFTEGDGWEMEDGEKKSWYPDTTHDVWIKSLKWSGNQNDQRESLVVAKGTNNFGPFVSVGWIRPGNRWTVARRYLSETDLRVEMPFRKFYEIVVESSISVDKEKGKKILLVPPWRIAAMHAKYQDSVKETPGTDDIGGGKRRKKVTM
jgi:hypothetical protein